MTKRHELLGPTSFLARRAGRIAVACGLAAAVGYGLEVKFFTDNESIASAWRILATAVVGCLLLTGIVAACAGWRRDR